MFFFNFVNQFFYSCLSLKKVSLRISVALFSVETIALSISIFRGFNFTCFDNMSISCNAAGIFSDTLSVEFRSDNRGDNGWEGKFTKDSSGKKGGDAGDSGGGPGGSFGETVENYYYNFYFLSYYCNLLAVEV